MHMAVHYLMPRSDIKSGFLDAHHLPCRQKTAPVGAKSNLAFLKQVVGEFGNDQWIAIIELFNCHPGWRHVRETKDSIWFLVIAAVEMPLQGMEGKQHAMTMQAVSNRCKQLGNSTHFNAKGTKVMTLHRLWSPSIKPWAICVEAADRSNSGSFIFAVKHCSQSVTVCDVFIFFWYKYSNSVVLTVLGTQYCSYV